MKVVASADGYGSRAWGILAIMSQTDNVPMGTRGRLMWIFSERCDHAVMDKIIVPSFRH